MRPPVFIVDGPGTEYTIDPGTLLAVAVDPDRMIRRADELMSRSGLAAECSAKRVGVAAFMLLTAGRAQVAEAMLRQQLPALANADKGLEVQFRLRLVQALQAQGRAAEAVDEARRALGVVAGRVGLRAALHIVHHHLGKALLQAQEPDEAERQLRKALELRRELGDKSLIESTEMALLAARRDA